MGSDVIVFLHKHAQFIGMIENVRIKLWEMIRP